MSKAFDYGQLVAFEKNIENAQKEFEDFLKKFLLEMAYRVIRDTKQRTPVDTGALRSMWAVAGGDRLASNPEFSGNLTGTATIEDVVVNGNDLEVYLVNGMNYASYVEYGTTKFDGRYMLTISLYDIERQMPLRFDKQFADFLQKHGAK
jgi:hypothetical protein